MQVSFGKIYVINEDPSTSRCQNFINKSVENSFTQMTNSSYKNLMNLEEYMKDKKNADIFIKNKKDGSVDLEVRQDAYDPNGDFGSRYLGFIPYDVKGKEKLKLTNIRIYPCVSGPDCEKTFKKDLDKFVKKCEKYAKAPKTLKNIKLAEENEITWEKYLIRIDDAINAQIEAMENFKFGN